MGNLLGKGSQKRQRKIQEKNGFACVGAGHCFLLHFYIVGEWVVRKMKLYMRVNNLFLFLFLEPFPKTYTGERGSDDQKNKLLKGTYEGHGVTCAGHDGLHHVHEHGEGKQDGNACKKSPTIKENKANLELLEYANREIYFYSRQLVLSKNIVWSQIFFCKITHFHL